MGMCRDEGSIPDTAVCADESALLQNVRSGRPVSWFNDGIAAAADGLGDVELGMVDVTDAEDRLAKFAPLLARLFPELLASGGIVESELRLVPQFQGHLSERYGYPQYGSLMVKLDSHLPVSGSIKARGGTYEVLKHAEDLALRAGLLRKTDDYSVLGNATLRSFFGKYTVMVGSTGNLGMAIGQVAAALGFQAVVHLSADAREWKKARLRESGVQLVEHAGDYSAAVVAGRHAAAADPYAHFVDDEHSRTLFLGYSVAALRLERQLDELEVVVDREHPLFVYLPCGVGGAPGGISFGLKLIYGDAVQCIFAEPTQSPSMLLGLCTGLHDQVSVRDFGLTNVTVADGLAVGRPSGFVGRAMRRLITGCFTVTDTDMIDCLALLGRSEAIWLEPSAIAGAPGPSRVMSNRQYFEQCHGMDNGTFERSTHLIWATGGGMVPAEELHQYLAGDCDRQAF